MWTHDQFWWRNDDRWRTAVTLWGGWLRPLAVPVSLDCVVRDAAGRTIEVWQQPIDPAWGAVVRSEHHSTIGDGVLDVSIAQAEVGDPGPSIRGSLYGLVDWYDDDGSLACLHSDQVPRAHRPVELTEIVVEAIDVEDVCLVLTAGTAGVAAGALSVSVTNAVGETRRAIDPSAVAPGGLHRLRLAGCFPALAAFAADNPITVGGTWPLGGHFVRPYVVTERSGFSAYHGGNLYDAMPTRHSAQYQIHGRGDLNPMAVVQRDGITTTFDVLNTHGTVEDAPWVDVRLYDGDGRLVTERIRWCRALRHRRVRGTLEEFLPDPSQPFIGHMVLSFADDGQAEFPFRLQALFRYAGPVNHARTMVWSDDWNSPIRRRRLGNVALPAYTRAWVGGRRHTSLLVANPGIPGLNGAYELTAPFDIRLTDETGRPLGDSHHVVGPHATLEVAIADLCGVQHGGETLAIVEATSNYDLAMIQITRDARSGAIGVEHLMAGRIVRHGTKYAMAGS